MGSILMVVADVLGHEPFQVSLVQDNHVIEQVSSATTDPTFRDPVLPGCGAQKSRRGKEKTEKCLVLQVLVGQISAMAVRLEPVVEMNLVQVRSDGLFSQFMRFGADERHGPTCQDD